MAEKKLITLDAATLDKLGGPEAAAKILSEAAQPTNEPNAQEVPNAQAAATQTQTANPPTQEVAQEVPAQPIVQAQPIAAAAPNVVQMTQDQLDKAIETAVSRRVAGMVAQTGIPAGQASVGSEPTPPPTEGTEANLSGTVEDAAIDAEKIWEANADVRHEFDSKESFTAYLKNERSGNVTVHRRQEDSKIASAIE